MSRPKGALGKNRKTLEERFWSKVQRGADDECWLWVGTATGGYGQLWDGVSTTCPNIVKAHRVAYELLVAPVPDGLELDHVCRVRQCVNPAHLEPVTHAENVRRAQALKTHCPYGHPYDEKNTYINPKGARVCRTCRRRYS